MSVQTARVAPAPRFADFKSDIKPVWCPGCGDYGVLSALIKALAELALAREEVALISGIGCSSRLPAYTSVYGFHAVHGRALAVASGLKAARPELTVIAAGGDGDGFSIGTNHFVHACRRDLDVTYIVMDNAVYGMTKGQASPTTEADWEGSKLTPDGPGIAPLRPLELALASGAGFIARGFSGQPKELIKLIIAAIRHPGFALVQVLTPCVTFRPEQSEYRDLVRQGFGDAGFDEPATTRREATLRLLDDDGFSLGLLYRARDRAAPATHRPHAATGALASFERAFAV